MNLEIQTTKGETAVAEKLGLDLSPEQVAVIKANVAKGVTDMELAYFLSLAKSVGLNPFKKEIWCYKDGRGNLLVFAGRDGFLANAQRHKDYISINSSDVRENDTFSIDIPNSEVKHSFGISERGKIVGAYAIVKRTKGQTVSYVDFKTYDRKMSAWTTHPAAMIRKVAEVDALKRAFGLAVNSEYEFDESNGVVTPHIEIAEPTEEENLRSRIVKAIAEADLTPQEKTQRRTQVLADIAMGKLSSEYVDQLELDLP